MIAPFVPWKQGRLLCSSVFRSFHFWRGLSWLPLGFALGLAQAGQEGGGPLDYDIPAQPLEAALETFGEISAAQVLYETALTSGQLSHAIKGRYSAEAALQLLLDGTDLAARPTAPGAFTISPTPKRGGIAPADPGDDGGVDPSSALPPRLRKYSVFLGLAQSEVLHALCARTITRPGDYHLEMRLWFAPSGAVSTARLVGSSGSPGRDAQILDLIQHLRVTLPAPEGLPQPIVMSISPRRPEATGDCPPFQ